MTETVLELQSSEALRWHMRSKYNISLNNKRSFINVNSSIAAELPELKWDWGLVIIFHLIEII